MSLYNSFLEVTGSAAKRIYHTAKRFAWPAINAITNTAENIKKAASVLTVVPLVGQVAASILTVSSAVYAVGSVIQDLLGTEAPPPDGSSVIFDGDAKMEQAFYQPPVVTFETPCIEYDGWPIAAPQGRRIYPTLQLDTPEIDMDGDIPYDCPEDTRNPKQL